MTQPRLEATARLPARHDENAQKRSLLKDLVLAHISVAGHYPELDGMNRHLAALLARETENVVAAALDRPRAHERAPAPTQLRF